MSRVTRHEVIQPLEEPYRYIPLTQGQNAIVDVEDFQRLSVNLWYAQWSPATKTFYARRSTNAIWMHRYLMDAQIGIVIDHRNKNTLDNRKENLRLCDYAPNSWNQGVNSRNRTSFKGVHFVPANKKWGVPKWQARIMAHGQRLNLGYFDSAEDAARAYDNEAREKFGEFAFLNFPTRFHCPHLAKRFNACL